ncbi:hypothetical protein I6E04_09730, partial [Collinsella tanakaei]|nr:hypothetical protein [Collinsella tanakaei]
ASKGWWKLSGKYYYFDPETFRTLTGEQEIAGRLYLFGDDGAAAVGWHEWADGTRSYFSSDYKGAASKGWWKLSGKYYYFDPET